MFDVSSPELCRLQLFPYWLIIVGLLKFRAWTKLFLEAQGYKIKKNLFAQNRRASSGQKTRHIDIRYFFIGDRIKTNGISIVYCPTEEMLADFFTKPLQGALFRKFRAVLLGYEHISIHSFVSPQFQSRSVLEKVEMERLEHTDRLRAF